MLAGITVLHMCFSLGWSLMAFWNLKNSSIECWQPMSYDAINYLMIAVILIQPAIYLALCLLMFIVCLPCIIHQVIQVVSNRRVRRQVGLQVV